MDSMRRVTILSFWLAGAAIGTFYGANAPYSNPKYILSSPSYELEQIGLALTGSLAGAYLGALITNLLPKPPRYLPMIGFVLALLFLGMRLAEDRERVRAELSSAPEETLCRILSI